MVTASHNPEPDNGAKLVSVLTLESRHHFHFPDQSNLPSIPPQVEPHGEMLVEAWEAHAARLANCKDEDVADVLQVCFSAGPCYLRANLFRQNVSCYSALQAIAQDEKVDWSVPARVIVGRDTRASGEALCKSLQDGCR